MYPMKKILCIRTQRMALLMGLFEDYDDIFKMNNIKFSNSEIIFF